MASLTIEGVDDLTLERLSDLAATRNKSLQVTAAEILRDSLPASDRARALHQLADELATMTLDRAARSDSTDLIREDRAR